MLEMYNILPSNLKESLNYCPSSTTPAQCLHRFWLFQDGSFSLFRKRFQSCSLCFPTLKTPTVESWNGRQDCSEHRNGSFSLFFRRCFQPQWRNSLFSRSSLHLPVFCVLYLCLSSFRCSLNSSCSVSPGNRSDLCSTHWITYTIWSASGLVVSVLGRRRDGWYGFIVATF